MMLAGPHTSGWVRHKPYGSLAGVPEDVLSRLDSLKAKYGDGMIRDGSEAADVMSLVGPFLKDDSWQYCTINAWLNGLPSEDDLDWKAKYFSEMPRLEEVCGDHSFFNQYNAAFDDLKSAGCPQAVMDWIRAKGQANFDFKRKGAKAEAEGERNLEKAKQSALSSINPFDPSSPFFWILLAVAAVYIYRTVKRPAQ